MHMRRTIRSWAGRRVWWTRQISCCCCGTLSKSPSSPQRNKTVSFCFCFHLKYRYHCCCYYVWALCLKVAFKGVIWHPSPSFHTHTAGTRFCTTRPPQAYAWEVNNCPLWYIIMFAIIHARKYYEPSTKAARASVCCSYLWVNEIALAAFNSIICCALFKRLTFLFLSFFSALSQTQYRRVSSCRFSCPFSSSCALLRILPFSKQLLLATRLCTMDGRYIF